MFGADAVVGIGADGRTDVDFLVNVFDLAVVLDEIWRLAALLVHVHGSTGGESDGRKRRHERRISMALKKWLKNALDLALLEKILLWARARYRGSI